MTKLTEFYQTVYGDHDPDLVCQPYCRGRSRNRCRWGHDALAYPPTGRCCANCSHFTNGAIEKGGSIHDGVCSLYEDDLGLAWHGDTCGMFDRRPGPEADA